MHPSCSKHRLSEPLRHPSRFVLFGDVCANPLKNCLYAGKGIGGCLTLIQLIRDPVRGTADHQNEHLKAIEGKTKWLNTKEREILQVHWYIHPKKSPLNQTKHNKTNRNNEISLCQVNLLPLLPQRAIQHPDLFDQLIFFLQWATSPIIYPIIGVIYSLKWGFQTYFCPSGAPF